MGNGIPCPLKYILVLSPCSPTSQMISQIWLQQFCCTIKTKHTNAKYTEGLFHPGMMHRDTFHNSQKCMLIILTDRREHNSSSCCQERLCCCDTTRNYTGTVQKSGVVPQQEEILPFPKNDSPFPKNFGWRLYHVLQISLEFKQKAKDITGVFTLLFCYGKGFSCSLHSAGSKSKGTELMWSNQQI